MNGGDVSILGIIALTFSGLSLSFSIFQHFAYRKLKAEAEQLREKAIKSLNNAEKLYEVSRKYSNLLKKLESVVRRRETV